MINIRIITLIFLSLLILIPFSLKAQTTQQLINQQDWLTRQQQNEIENSNREREQETIRKERIRKEKEKKRPEPFSYKTKKCLIIKSVNMVDSGSISEGQNKILTPFIGKCVDKKTLVEIFSSAQSYYNNQGYVTPKIATHKQKIYKKQPKIKKGKVDEVVVGDNQSGDKAQQLTAFGSLEGEELDLEEIEQGIYQMNRLPSNNVTVKVVPAEEKGKAKIIISNQKKFPVRGKISYDNLGNNFTGIYRTGISGGVDNLLSLNDTIDLNYSTNLNDKDNLKDFQSFSSGISVPYGFNTFSYSYSRSQYRGADFEDGTMQGITGFSQKNNLGIDRVLLKKEDFRLASNASLATKSSSSYVNDQKVTGSQRRLSIATIGFTISDYFKNGIELYLKPSYSRGLRILNAQKDNPDAGKEAPKAQFDYFKFYGTISKKFTMPKTEIPFTLAVEMDSQYSRQTLYGTEQFSVGGYYSVRGFRENYIAGDSGYYFRNKANINVGSLFNPFIKKYDEGFLGKNYAYLNKFSIEPFYDYGYVKNKYAGNGADGRLSGAGIKTLFNSKYFNASLTYSEAINRSRLITSNKKEDRLIYFEINASCC